MKFYKIFLPFFIYVLFTGCTQVPRESIELSNTVGRDISEMYRAHRELVTILYERIKSDVDKFVDDVYVPFQIKKILKSDYDDFKQNDPNSLFYIINKAQQEPDNDEIQQTMIETMDIFMNELNTNIESYRKKRLEPIIAQEEEVLSKIDRSYNQIIYANSIITGHLASVVQVYDAQQEILNALGLKDFSSEISQKLTDTSNKIAAFTKKAKKVNGTLDEMEMKVKDFTSAFDSLFINPVEKMNNK